MNRESSKLQLQALIKRRMKLANFELEVNHNIANGNADRYLVITDADGSHPIVVALGEEPIVLLNERVMAIGGRATVFVQRTRGVTVLVADMVMPAEAPDALDMTRDNWVSGEATIDAFLALLAEHPHGVILPDRLPGTVPTNVTLCSEDVSLETVPA